MPLDSVKQSQTAPAPMHVTVRKNSDGSISGTVPEYIVRDFEAMAHIAIAYFGECLDKLQRRN